MKYIVLMLTKSLLGQLEKTMAESFTRSANLRALIHRPNQHPKAIKACQSIFDRLVDPKTRNTLTSDAAGFLSAFSEPEFNSEWEWNPHSATRPSVELQHALVSHLPAIKIQKAQFVNHIIRHGLHFTTSEKHFGNSSILIRELSKALPGFPGVIQSIFRAPVSTDLDQVRTLIAIRRYQKLSISAISQPQYPLLGLSVWDTRLGELEIFNIEDIECHFASLQSEFCGHSITLVVSLSRIAPAVPHFAEGDIPGSDVMILEQ